MSFEWDVISDRKSIIDEEFTELQDSEHAPLFRVVFNAQFYRSVGFVTKRAADSMMSLLQDVYKCAMDDIMMIVREKRHMVKTHLLTKHQKNIYAANTQDKAASDKLKKSRIQRYIEQAQRVSSIDPHFDRIRAICESDIDNTISRQVLLYMTQNSLIK